MRDRVRATDRKRAGFELRSDVRDRRSAAVKEPAQSSKKTEVDAGYKKRHDLLPLPCLLPACFISAMHNPDVSHSFSQPGKHVDRSPPRPSPRPGLVLPTQSLQNQIYELAKTLPPPRKQNTACDACRSVFLPYLSLVPHLVFPGPAR